MVNFKKNDLNNLTLIWLRSQSEDLNNEPGRRNENATLRNSIDPNPERIRDHRRIKYDE